MENKSIDNLKWNIKTKLKYLYSYVYISLSAKNKRNNYLKNVHNKYKGQRCFILGNGPSLIPEDLNKLKNEITFASNRIYKIFDKTDWRPTFFAMFDEGVAESDGVIDGVNTIDCVKFVREQGYFSYKKMTGNTYFIHSFHGRKYLDKPAFSENLYKGLYTIGTVTYAQIQFARWMGFDEIYLLGMDNRYKFGMTRDGKVYRNEGVCNYFGEEAKEEPLPTTAPATWEMDVAYEFADKYSREHRFRIYNATRGGFLEKFERVNLDEVLGINKSN